MIIAIITVFVTFSTMYAYSSKYSICSYLDYYEAIGIFGPIFAGIFWPVTLIGGWCYFLYKKWLKKYYQRFVKWLGDKLFQIFKYDIKKKNS